jgi:hypothetical protein
MEMILRFNLCKFEFLIYKFMFVIKKIDVFKFVAHFEHSKNEPSSK